MKGGGKSREEEIEKGKRGKVIKAKQAKQHWELITDIESESLEHCFGQSDYAV